MTTEQIQEQERLLLNLFLCNTSLHNRVEDLEEALFTEAYHKEIVRIIKQIVKEGGIPDVPVICVELGRCDYFDLDCYSDYNFDYLLNELRERSQKDYFAKELNNILREPDETKKDRLLEKYLQEKRKNEAVTFAPYLDPYGIKEAKQEAKMRGNDLPTGYKLQNENKTPVDLSLPSGALTFFCAPTSHGKSTLLRNFALSVAFDVRNEGSVLYYSYEEERFKILCQMLNTHFNKDLNNGGIYNNNLRCIEAYLRGEERDYINKDIRDKFEKGVSEFDQKIKTDKLRLFYSDYYLDELIKHIRGLYAQEKVDAVFIDYIQLIHIRNNKDQRREELRIIAQKLRNLAIELRIPIVLGAQLNKEAKSPTHLANEHIAESVDIAREANTIVCVWNTSFTANEESKELGCLEDAFGFKLGTGGKLYAIMTKNRSGERGLKGIFLYNGNTGRINNEDDEAYTSNNEAKITPF